VISVIVRAKARVEKARSRKGDVESVASGRREVEEGGRRPAEVAEYKRTFFGPSAEAVHLERAQETTAEVSSALEID